MHAGGFTLQWAVMHRALGACGDVNGCTHEQFNCTLKKLFWEFFFCCLLILICMDVLTSSLELFFLLAG